MSEGNKIENGFVGIEESFWQEFSSQLKGVGLDDDAIKLIQDMEIGTTLSGRVGTIKWQTTRLGVISIQLKTSLQENPQLADNEIVAEKRQEVLSGLTEEMRAEHYWHSRLEGEIRIEKPQDPRCVFAIVVPVFDERPDRILKQKFLPDTQE